MTTKFKIQKVTNQQSEYKMSLYELEGIPKAYSLQAQEVQRGREAKIQHLLAQVCLSFFFFAEMTAFISLGIILVKFLIGNEKGDCFD